MAEQPLCVLRLGDDVDASVPREGGRFPAGEREVVRDDYARGISAGEAPRVPGQRRSL
jgi:hypothetical protein